MIFSKGASENTSEGMAKGGSFYLSTGGTTGKVFNRSISSIDVKSGAVDVVLGVQTAKGDVKRLSDYPDMVNVTLSEGIHVVDFSKAELANATGFTQVNYGV